MVTIHISKYDLEKITVWNKNNGDKRIATCGKFPYSSFRIELEDKEYGTYGFEVFLIDNEVNRGYVSYFCQSEKHFKIFDGYEKINNDFMKVKNPKATDADTHYAMVYGTFIFIMAYIQHKMSKRKVVIVENAKQVKARENSGKRVAKTKDSFLLNDFVVYEHKANAGIKHTYTCESWGVKGHYRHYKSGKVVFVKEYTKGRNKGKNADKNVYLRKVK